LRFKKAAYRVEIDFADVFGVMAQGPVYGKSGSLFLLFLFVKSALKTAGHRLN